MACSILTPRSAVSVAEDREAMARSIFSEFDKDDSGEISHDEMIAILKALALSADDDPALTEVDEAQFEREFMKADTDGDGQINFAEFCSYYNMLLSYQLAGGGEAAGASSSLLFGAGAASSHQLWHVAAEEKQSFLSLCRKMVSSGSLCEDDLAVVEFILESDYRVVDLRLAVLAYRQAETTMPLRRLLQAVEDEMERVKSTQLQMWQVGDEECESFGPVIAALGEESKISEQDCDMLTQLIAERSNLLEIKTALLAYQHAGSELPLQRLLLALHTEKEAKGGGMSGGEFGEEYDVEDDEYEEGSGGGGGMTGIVLGARAQGITRVDVDNRAAFDPVMAKAAAEKLSGVADKRKMVGLLRTTFSRDDYLKVMSSANIFYGDSVEVEFDDDLIAQLTGIVYEMKNRGMLEATDVGKCLNLLEEQDKYVIYCLYKYTDEAASLRCYLKYRKTANERAAEQTAARVRSDQRLANMRTSLDEFAAERKAVFEMTRDELARNPRAKAEPEPEPEPAKPAKKKKKKKEKHKPRWLLLYEAKFDAYANVLQRDGQGSQKKLVQEEGKEAKK